MTDIEMTGMIRRELGRLPPRKQTEVAVGLRVLFGLAWVPGGF